MSKKRLEEDHQINIFGFQRLWNEIRDYFIYNKKQVLDKPLKELKREGFKKKWDGLLKEILEDTNSKIGELS